MFRFIYVERNIQDLPLVKQICQQYNVQAIYCEKYGDIFHQDSQNFRLQKENPSLILAKKTGQLVLKTPKEYGIGGTKNYYFSHLFNCPFDCRYCSLQGQYSSANFVLFANYKDFQNAILDIIQQNPGETCTFFCGYNGDSLALEPTTHFLKNFLPFYADHPEAIFEIRTKSTNISILMQSEALYNCVIAYSLMPKDLSASLEHKASSIENRLDAIKRLQEHGWKIGLRFDPLIYCSGFEEKYAQFFDSVFQAVNLKQLHSVTLSPFRLAKTAYQKMTHLYPDEKLYAHSLTQKGHLIGYRDSLENQILKFCYDKIQSYVPKDKLFAILS
ncbi:putative DNA repair photolyase [Chlamydiales bacterium STE3]|nr:putative DNA repair photolyase [Chlamydiales bacterium STE3]